MEMCFLLKRLWLYIEDIRQELNMVHSCIKGKAEDLHNSAIKQICDVKTLQFLVHETISIKTFQFLLLL